MRLPRELNLTEIFKHDSFSPGKITLQITILQLFYYLTASLLFCVGSKLGGYKLELVKWLFSWEPIEFSNALGLTLTILWLLDSLICVIFLTVIVGRSKLAWDFAITVHAINLLAVIIYTKRLPSLSWLILQIMSSLILIFLGTWTTRWRELRDTFFEGLVDQEISNQPPKPIQMEDIENQTQD